MQEIKRYPLEFTKPLTSRRGAMRREGQTLTTSSQSIMPRQVMDQVLFPIIHLSWLILVTVSGGQVKIFKIFLIWKKKQICENKIQDKCMKSIKMFFLRG